MDAIARPWLATGWAVVAVGGATTTAELRRMCDRAEALLRSDPRIVLACDLSGIDVPDLGAVDALARLRLTAARHAGATLLLRRLTPQLVVLLRWTGLEDAVLDR
jgi:hypothetical protein